MPVGHVLRVRNFVLLLLRSGRTLGHAEIEVWRDRDRDRDRGGELLLAGRHSKLMASPVHRFRLLEQLLGHPLVFPLTQRALTSYFSGLVRLVRVGVRDWG